jgi:hypothetical protein
MDEQKQLKELVDEAIARCDALREEVAELKTAIREVFSAERAQRAA